MTQLHTKIKIYLNRDYKDSEIELQNDGEGTYIKFWSDSLEKSKPTDEQLDALSSQATALENTAKIDAKRQTEYLSWQEQFEMIYKDQKNGTSTYKDHCDKVRSDNPKE